jgi:uncharacterized protein YjiS (DUF1127 family)
MDGNVPLRDQLPLRSTGAARVGTARQPMLVVLADRLMTWIERARSRRALASLDDRMLRDFGADRATIYPETQKPFWRA